VAQSSTQILAEAVADIGAVLFVGAVLAGPARRLRQPRVIAEVLAGVALGPSLLGLLPGHLVTRLFPLAVRPDLNAIAQVGILLFMFMVGWDLDPARIRSRGVAVLSISLSCIALPLVLGCGLALWLYHDHGVVAGKHVGEPGFVLFVGTAMAITAFPVLARIIREQDLRGTRIAVLALSSAAVGDVLAWCLLAVVAAVAASAGPGQLLRMVGYSAGYGVLLVLVVRPLLKLLISRLSREGSARPELLMVIAAGVFVSGYVAQWIGLDSIFGAFAFGLAMPRGSLDQLRASVHQPFEQVATLLMPIFFISTGLSVDIAGLGAAGWLQAAAIFAAACFGKVAAGTLAARANRLPWSESAAVGVLMNTRGLTELIVLNVGVTMGVLDNRLFTMMVIMALVTTGMAGPLLSRRGRAAEHGGFPLDLPETADEAELARAVE
jgi:Kef-type K+ transport system membrane component KefB